MLYFSNDLSHRALLIHCSYTPKPISVVVFVLTTSIFMTVATTVSHANAPVGRGHDDFTVDSPFALGVDSRNLSHTDAELHCTHCCFPNKSFLDERVFSPTWRRLLFVWPLTYDLFGRVDPTRTSLSQHSSQAHWSMQAFPRHQASNMIRGRG